MRANLYAFEQLPEAQKQTFLAGIERFGAYIGERTISNVCQLEVHGTIDEDITDIELGIERLNPEVEMHVLAFPFSEQGALKGTTRLGAHPLIKGVVYLNTKANERHWKSTAMHEAAHSLGFMLPGTAHANPRSPEHCINTNCLLNAHIMGAGDGGIAAVIAAIKDTESRRTIKKVTRVLDQLIADEQRKQPTTQSDFCLDCLTQLHKHGQSQLEDLRQHRLTYGMAKPSQH